MINSLAVIYVYNQFSSLRKAGSKYLLSKSDSFVHMHHGVGVVLASTHFLELHGEEGRLCYKEG